MFQTNYHRIDNKLKCEMKLPQENIKEKLVNLGTQRLAGGRSGGRYYRNI